MKTAIDVEQLLSKLHANEFDKAYRVLEREFVLSDDMPTPRAEIIERNRQQKAALKEGIEREAE